MYKNLLWRCAVEFSYDCSDIACLDVCSIPLQAVRIQTWATEPSPKENPNFFMIFLANNDMKREQALQRAGSSSSAFPMCVYIYLFFPTRLDYPTWYDILSLPSLTSKLGIKLWEPPVQKQVEHATDKRTFCKSLLRKAFGHCFFFKILHVYDVAQDVAKFGSNLDKFLSAS